MKKEKKPPVKDWMKEYINDRNMFMTFLMDVHMKEYIKWLEQRYKNIPDK